MRVGLLTALISVLAILGPLVAEGRAGVITVMIGDDDGFGGTQGPKSNPGDPFTVFSSPAIAPGTYLNESGLDATTVAPWNPYVFRFVFSYDSTSLASVLNATVTIQSGSLARRTDGSGFGYASVTADGGAGPTNLGDVLTVSTGSAASSAEEIVRDLSFDVSSLITTSSAGTLTFTIDGSRLSSPDDQFALDFARLTVVGSAVPEPASHVMLVIGVVALLGYVRLRSKACGCAAF